MTASVLQERQTQNSATGTTLTLAYSSALTPGSTLHAAASNDTGGGVTISSFSDGTNGTWTLSDVLNDAGNAQNHGHGWFINNASSATPTVTVTFSATVVFRGLAIKEIGGVVTTAADTHKGQVQTAVGTGTDAISSSTVANTNQPAIQSVFTINTGNNTTTAATGTGFTTGAGYWASIYGGSTNRGFSESQRITTTTAKAGTYTASATGSNWITLMAVFDEASAAAVTGVLPSPRLQFVH